MIKIKPDGHGRFDIWLRYDKYQSEEDQAYPDSLGVDGLVELKYKIENILTDYFKKEYD